MNAYKEWFVSSVVGSKHFALISIILESLFFYPFFHEAVFLNPCMYFVAMTCFRIIKKRVNYICYPLLPGERQHLMSWLCSGRNRARPFWQTLAFQIQSLHFFLHFVVDRFELSYSTRSSSLRIRFICLAYCNFAGFVFIVCLRCS